MAPSLLPIPIRIPALLSSFSSNSNNNIQPAASLSLQSPPSPAAPPHPSNSPLLSPRPVRDSDVSTVDFGGLLADLDKEGRMLNDEEMPSFLVDADFLNTPAAKRSKVMKLRLESEEGEDEEMEEEEMLLEVEGEKEVVILTEREQQEEEEDQNGAGGDSWMVQPLITLIVNEPSSLSHNLSQTPLSPSPPSPPSPELASLPDPSPPPAPPAPLIPLTKPSHLLPKNHPSHPRPSLSTRLSPPPLPSTLKRSLDHFSSSSSSTTSSSQPSINETAERPLAQLPKKRLSLLAPPLFSPILPNVQESPMFSHVSLGKPLSFGHSGSGSGSGSGSDWSTGVSGVGGGGGRRLTSTPNHLVESGGVGVRFNIPEIDEMEISIVEEIEVEETEPTSSQDKDQDHPKETPIEVEPTPTEPPQLKPKARRVSRIGGDSTTTFSFSTSTSTSEPTQLSTLQPLKARRVSRLPTDLESVPSSLLLHPPPPKIETTRPLIARRISIAPPPPPSQPSTLPETDLKSSTNRRASKVFSLPPTPALPSTVKTTTKPISTIRLTAPPPPSTNVQPQTREKEKEKGGMTLTLPREFVSRGAEREIERKKRVEERVRREKEEEERERAKVGGKRSGGKEELKVNKRQKLASSLPPNQQRPPLASSTPSLSYCPPVPLSLPLSDPTLPTPRPELELPLIPLTKEALELSHSHSVVVNSGEKKAELKRRVSSYLEGVILEEEEDEVVELEVEVEVEKKKEVMKARRVSVAVTQPPAKMVDQVMLGEQKLEMKARRVSVLPIPQTQIQNSEKLRTTGTMVGEKRKPLGDRNTQNHSKPTLVTKPPSKSTLTTTTTSTTKLVSSKPTPFNFSTSRPRTAPNNLGSKLSVWKARELELDAGPVTKKPRIEGPEKEGWEIRQKKREEEVRRVRAEKRRVEEEEEKKKLKMLRESLKAGPAGRDKIGMKGRVKV